MEVVATGGVDVWEPAGRYQLYIRKLEPRGVGALELAFRQLCDKLQAEGLFDATRKKPLPTFPRTIAVVTSPTGAAVRDILKTLRRRFPCARVLIAPVAVQGDAASGEIATAIQRLNQQSERLGGIDVMIVGRGGGSIEDLWAFNTEAVARAVAGSDIPVISGVGHEVDTTICDLVADARAHTPTAAAEMAVPVLVEVLDALDAAAGRLRRALTAEMDVARTRFQAVAGNAFFRRPVDRLHRLEQGLDEQQARLRLAATQLVARLGRRVRVSEDALGKIHPLRFSRQLTDRLTRLAHRLGRAGPGRQLDAGTARIGQISLRVGTAMQHRLTLAAQQTDTLAKRIASVSYKSVLKRGYSITRESRRGKVITDPGQVKPGDRVRTETDGGSFDAEVFDPDEPTLF
jgi:exodeoxyribonuclease VII large subunit